MESRVINRKPKKRGEAHFGHSSVPKSEEDYWADAGAYDSHQRTRNDKK
eukprot:CAMPEP_0185030952 /NCGR_PEP_ID=MMETSP1103-20130426/18122_1 /TAXON_ID=36769 /ORGANISM="Paraphysomonas bandaiensis, Strain Caron Lab Isolate" /LENGTH=48 /DNA_ID= /DNA_START= /DNA_END= /DNA_ORIENTATION=